MCDKAVDDYLGALKLIPDWSVTSKIIKQRYTVLYANDGLLFFDEDSDDVIFCCDEIGILCANLNNINLDNNFDGNNPDTIICIRLFARHSKFKKDAKQFKRR